MSTTIMKQEALEKADQTNLLTGNSYRYSATKMFRLECVCYRRVNFEFYREKTIRPNMTDYHESVWVGREQITERDAEMFLYGSGDMGRSEC